MPSVIAVSVPQPAPPSRRRLIASGHIRPRSARLTPKPTSTTCVWCGHAIYATDPTERIGLAEVHQFPCVEQFEIHAYGEEGNR
jgi:hypothetical protein